MSRQGNCGSGGGSVLSNAVGLASNGGVADQTVDPQPNVVLVDFAHTIPSEGQVDRNFLGGLSKAATRL